MYDIAECNVPVIREWALKQRHEYSIADFSRLTGISPSHIRNILFQYDGIGLLSAKRISVGTGIPIEKLIGEDEEPTRPTDQQRVIANRVRHCRSEGHPERITPDMLEVERMVREHNAWHARMKRREAVEEMVKHGIYGERVPWPVSGI